jgi:hypothetical protein
MHKQNTSHGDDSSLILQRFIVHFFCKLDWLRTNLTYILEEGDIYCKASIDVYTNSMLHVNRDHDVARLSPISYMPAWHWVHVSYNKAVQKRCSVTIFNWGHHAWPLTSLTGRDPACMHAYDILCNNAPASTPASQKQWRTRIISLGRHTV